MIDPLPFEQQPQESAKAFAAFVRYRDMKQEHRSIDAAWRGVSGAYTEPKQAPTHWKRWAIRHDWVERAKSYDALLDARARHAAELDTIEQRKATFKAHADEGKAMRQVGRGGLNLIAQLLKDAVTFDEKIRAASLAVRYLEAGQRMERQAMGETVEILAPPVPIGQMDLETLTEFVSQLETRLAR